ncbi:GEVED domain-containing protein [Allostreptomyces psammosilenae]|uniref:Bacterial Ig-like domain-containing protein n=1 Tax=Allostreptomyces psammosilenae TaxID=1892865 RepID=A0A853A7C0_9ACTN|nr:GEVED domain-containing protein [Allostreptomyces psammosilenae]NYI06561.1 hypothetical protein [Allostreptomyces psammosilenae]
MALAGAGAFVVGTSADAYQRATEWDAGTAALPSGLRVTFTESRGPDTSSLYLQPDGVLPEDTQGLLDPVDMTGAPAHTARWELDDSSTYDEWRRLGSQTLEFSRPVRDPRLHLYSGVAWSHDQGSKLVAPRLTLTGGDPDTPTLRLVSGGAGYTVTDQAIAPGTSTSGYDSADRCAAAPSADPATASTPRDPSYFCGTVELGGTLTSATFQVDAVLLRQGIGTTAEVSLRHQVAVSVDEDLGNAPAGYGDASAVISDVYLGADATADRATTVSAVPENDTATTTGTGTGSGSGGAGGAASPGDAAAEREEDDVNDAAVRYAEEAVIGEPYTMTVPVTGGSGETTLAGWIDWNGDESFAEEERATAEVPAGADSAELTWTVPNDAASGDVWSRLRIGYSAEQTGAPTGRADSGEVEDHLLEDVVVRVAAPTIDVPSHAGDASPTAALPNLSGTGLPGATVTVHEAGGTEVCRAPVAADGTWRCTPPAGTPAGDHQLYAVQISPDGAISPPSSQVVMTVGAGGSGGSGEAGGGEGDAGTGDVGDTADAGADGETGDAGETGTGEGEAPADAKGQDFVEPAPR